VNDLSHGKGKEICIDNYIKIHIKKGRIIRSTKGSMFGE